MLLHRLIIEVGDSLVERVTQYLRSFPVEKAKILKENPHKAGNHKAIDFSKYTIASLQNISDPISRQRELRSDRIEA